jgi:hypothetical protein
MAYVRWSTYVEDLDGATLFVDHHVRPLNMQLYCTARTLVRETLDV